MDNRREEQRIEHNIKFFVHVHECDDDPDMVGVSVVCHAIDFSPRGLQLKTETQLLPSSILNITIGIGDPFSMYLLRGEIRWIRGADADVQMGILLRDVPGTDYSKWGQEFVSIFSKEARDLRPDISRGRC